MNSRRSIGATTWVVCALILQVVYDGSAEGRGRIAAPLHRPVTRKTMARSYASMQRLLRRRGYRPTLSINEFDDLLKKPGVKLTLHRRKGMIVTTARAGDEAVRMRLRGNKLTILQRSAPPGVVNKGTVIYSAPWGGLIASQKLQYTKERVPMITKETMTFLGKGIWLQESAPTRGRKTGSMLDLFRGGKKWIKFNGASAYVDRVPPAAALGRLVEQVSAPRPAGPGNPRPSHEANVQLLKRALKAAGISHGYVE